MSQLHNIELLLAEDLAEEVRQDLEEHIEGCACCQDILSGLASDPALERWVALGQQPKLDEHIEFVGRLRQQYSTLVSTSLASSETRTSSDPFTISAPEALEGCRIEEEIGRGGYGAVYEAYDERLERWVAIKLLRPDLAQNAEQRKRFVRDAVAASRLKHDHVVTVYKAGESRDWVYYVMEYLPEGTLADRLRETSSVSSREAARIVRHIALGVHGLHEAGFIHRDIKPSNVLFDSMTERFKIADFGLAREIADGGTIERGRAGTPAYMSPEHYRTPSQVDERSDVFSIGVVLYQLLTGSRPFVGSPEQLESQILNGDPSFPQLSPPVPKDLQSVALKCMAKEPARRYQTAAKLADDLQRWLEGEPVVARRPSGARRLRMWAKREPRIAGLLSAVSLLVVALLVGSWVYTGLLTTAYAAQERSLERTRGAARELAGTLNNLAVHQIREERLQEASQSLEAAAGIFERLSREERLNQDLQHESATVHYNLGLVVSKSGQSEVALDLYRKAIDVWEALAREEPDVLAHDMWLARAHYNRGLALRGGGKRQTTIEAFRTASELGLGLVARDPERTEVALDTAKSCRRLADAILHSLDLTDSRNRSVLPEFSAWHQRAIETLEGALTRVPDHGGTPGDSSRLLRRTYEGGNRIGLVPGCGFRP